MGLRMMSEVDPEDAVTIVSERLASLENHASDAAVRLATIQGDIKQLVAHAERTNGRLGKLEDEVHAEQLTIARAEATRVANAGMRGRDITFLAVGVSVLGLGANVLAQIFTGG